MVWFFLWLLTILKGTRKSSLRQTTKKNVKFGNFSQLSGFGWSEKTLFLFWYGKQLFLVLFGHIRCHGKFEVPVIILTSCARPISIRYWTKNFFFYFFNFFCLKKIRKQPESNIFGNGPKMLDPCCYIPLESMIFFWFFEIKRYWKSKKKF